MSTISPLPQPPSTASPSTFDTLADAFIAALPQFVTQTNTVASEVNTNAGIAVTASNVAAAAQATIDAAVPSLEDFNTMYLGAKAVAPSLDNNGDPLIEGAMYFDSVNNILKIWDGFAWQTSAGTISPNFSILRETATATAGQTVFNLTNSFIVGTNTIMVYVNGVRQILTSAYTETSVSQITFTSGLAAGDEVMFEIGVVAAGSNVLAGNTTFSPITGNSATNVQAALSNVQTQLDAHTSKINNLAGNTMYLAQFSAI